MARRTWGDPGVLPGRTKPHIFSSAASGPRAGGAQARMLRLVGSSNGAATSESLRSPDRDDQYDR